MNDLFPNISHFARTYLSEEFLLLAAGAPGVLGCLFNLAFFFYSVLRVNRAMKRDGIEAPSLHWLSIIGYLNLFAASRKSIANMIKTEQDLGIKKHSFGLCVTIIQPYIKPVDRFISRSFFFLIGISALFLLIDMWLYPD